MSENIVITPSPDMMQPEDAVSLYLDVKDGFTFNTPDITLKAEIFQKFIKHIQTDIEKLDFFDFSKTKNTIFRKYIGKNIRVYCSGNSKEIYCTIVANSEIIAQKAWDIFLKYTEDDKKISIFMQSYFMNNNNLDSTTKELEKADIEYISKSYYPYIDTDIMFDQFFTGSENILLLVGLPGLGKSKMATLALKHALENPNVIPYDKLKDNSGIENQFINTVYVKSNDVLINDRFWREMEKQEIDFCIIDDLDYMLTKRSAEVQGSDDLKRNGFLNQFLSFTDGVEKNKTKFIITTNQSYSEIDAALLRKGRLFDILELRSLTREEAFEIWNEKSLSSEDFDKCFGLDVQNVLSADLGSEISKLLNDRIKTAKTSYLKEEKISKVKSAKRVKQISV